VISFSIKRTSLRTLPLTAALLSAPLLLSAASVMQAPWGKTVAGDPVVLYTITSLHSEVKISTYGARIVSIRVPDRQRKLGDVVLGFDSVDGYFSGRTSVMGATIGRFANRIAGGEFAVDGVAYHIPKNSGNNAIHGGTIGFDKKIWKGMIVRNGVEMTLVSPDGDMGFPGSLTVHVIFTLAEQNGNPVLSIKYSAVTDKPTVINLTNHSYFNLADDPRRSVLGDRAQFNADSFTPVDASGIPTGILQAVAGTQLDFREMHAIGDRIPPRGYDNNLALRQPGIQHMAAEVIDPASGRVIQVFTTQPGFQFYVPLSPIASAANSAGRPQSMAAFCIETQHFPDSPNHPNFPSTKLRPGQAFRSQTKYVFGTAKNEGER
jgi:aldose 1-epimerase